MKDKFFKGRNDMQTTQERYFTIREFSDMMKVDVTTTRLWLRKKELPYFKHHRTVRIPETAIQEKIVDATT